MDPWQLLREIHRRSIWQVLGVYAFASWSVLEVVDVLVDTAGLPSWFPALALGLLLIGLPVVLATAIVQRGPSGESGDAASPTERARSGSTRLAATRRLFTWRNAVGGGVVAFALWGVVAGAWFLRSGPFEGGAEDAGAPVVAVLPFANLSGAAEADAFVLGVHDDILTQLSKIRALKVISRTSVMEYRESPKNLRTIADELGASVILEGGVQRSGERVRVNAQLIDARTDEHLWAETYDRQLSPENIFEIQGELARSIAAALDATLSPAEERRIAKAATRSLAAYDLVARGKELYATGREENETAVELFRQATLADPQYAAAWAELANAYGQRVQTYGYPKEWADSGVVLARRSLEIDPELPVGWKALGLNLDQLGRHRKSGEAYRRALEIEPSYGSPMINLAASAGFLGRCDEQHRLARRVVELQPRSPYPPLHVAQANSCMGRDAEAERWLARTRAVQEDFVWAVLGAVWLDLARERDEEARRRVDALLSEDPRNLVGLLLAGQTGSTTGAPEYTREAMETLLAAAPQWGLRAAPATTRTLLAWALLESGGDEARAAALLDEAEALVLGALRAGMEDPMFQTEMAAVRALRGDAEGAVQGLDRAYDAGERGHRLLRRDRRFASLFDDPRFQDIMDRMRSDVAAQRARIEAEERP